MPPFAQSATTVVGVDGSGRSHRLAQLAATFAGPVLALPSGPGPDLLSGPGPDLAGRLAGAAPGTLVIVDDAHRCAGPVLTVLADAARRGVPMLIARRPTIDRPELAELDEAVAAGGITQLEPLDIPAVAHLVGQLSGRRVPAVEAVRVHTASGGLPAVVAAMAGAVWDDRRPRATPALMARVQRHLARRPAETTALARVLALRLQLPDRVLSLAAGLPVNALPALMRELRDSGWLTADGESMLPAIAVAIHQESSPAEHRRVHEAVATALLTGSPPPVHPAGPAAEQPWELVAGRVWALAAEQLRAAGVRGPAAAAVYRRAGECLRFARPAEALAWFDEAAAGGADPGAGRAEAAALLGLAHSAEVSPDTARDGRFALVAGAVAAHEGRAGRAAETLLAAAAPGPLLAVPALVSVGRLETARSAVGDVGRVPAPDPVAGRVAGPEAGPPSLPSAPPSPRPEPGPGPGPGPGPVGLLRLAEAGLVIGCPERALPLLVEAAEAVERTIPAVVLPDTPHAIGALVAMVAGDQVIAESLLRRASVTAVGGPIAAHRHRLLLAWVRLRAGRYDTAAEELRGLAEVPLPAREALLYAALGAGLARRHGESSSMRRYWAEAEPLLARDAIDLLQIEPLEELSITAARLRTTRRIEPVLGRLERIVADLGSPPAWTVAVHWIRLQVAVASDDGASAARAAAALTEAEAKTITLGDRQRAQCAAARVWTAILHDRAGVPDVRQAATRLAEAGLPWEGSCLATRAAPHLTGEAAARPLFGQSREPIDPAPPSRKGTGVLSAREQAVARLVLAGRTHREIGAQLYISAKTVEHHVARIRVKLGAVTRAELVSALRRALGDSPIP